MIQLAWSQWPHGHTGLQPTYHAAVPAMGYGYSPPIASSSELLLQSRSPDNLLQTLPGRSSITNRAHDDGVELAELLARRRVGEQVEFGRVLQVAGDQFTGATIERDLGSASGAQLITLWPRGVQYILKFEDVRMEVAAMSTLRRMNQIWRQSGAMVCGVPVEAVTYTIVPLGRLAGLVEVVPRSRTLRELSATFSWEARHVRVVHALNGDPRKLDKLAATTAAYLTAGYMLGIRDGHDDNIMLRDDGALFRVDYGFMFGRTPEIDAPATFVPRAVSFALGDHRWNEVVGCSNFLLSTLCGPSRREGAAWDFLRSVRELAPYHAEACMYGQKLSLEQFNQEVRHADEWSLSRAVKNTLREVKKYVYSDSQAPNDDVIGVMTGVGIEPRVAPGRMLPAPTSQAPRQPRVEALSRVSASDSRSRANLQTWFPGRWDGYH